MDINRFIITDDTLIYKAASIIDANGHPIVFICNEDGNLLASLSDGDIRRYVLKNDDLSKPVKIIANYSVRSLSIENQLEASKLINEYKLKAIPIVDEEQKIISIIFSGQIRVNREFNLNIPVVIMAGGKGSRLAPYTNILPKPLIPIGDKTITERIMDQFTIFGCHEFHMIVNYKKELIKAYFNDTENEYEANFHEEDVFLGTGGGLKLLKGVLNSTFFMTNCDTLIYANYEALLNFHRQKGYLATMICAEKTVVLPYGTIELNETGSPISLTEKPEYPLVTNTGLYVIEPEFFDFIPNGEVMITDIFKKLLATKRLGVYTISDSAWLDMGEFEQMDKMSTRINAFDMRS